MFRKIKNNRISLLILLFSTLLIVSLVVLVTSIIGVNIGGQRKKEGIATTDLTVVDPGYLLPGLDFTKDTVRIRSQEDFDEFIDHCNQITHLAGCVTEYTYLNTFSGQNIYLHTDVTLSESIDCPFAGTFDGNGHSISGPSTLKRNLTDGTNTYTGAFLQVASSAIIKNTIFKNFYIFDESNEKGVSYSGVIAGINYGNIISCIVENCSFESDRYNSNCYTSPIVGYNHGNVQACTVQGKHRIGAHDANTWFDNADGIKAFTFVYGTAERYCFYNATLERFGVKSNIERRTFTNNANGNSSYTSDNITNLSEAWSAKGGKELGNDYWYYASDYSPFPWLRCFLSWKTVELVEGSGADLKGVTSIEIPSDANKTYSTKSGSDAFTIYNQTVTAYRKSDYCPHSTPTWVCNSAVSYTVSYNRPYRSLKIYIGDSTTHYQTVGKSCCSEISVTLGPYTKDGPRKITISGIVYIAPDEYYISNAETIKSTYTKLDASKDIRIQLAIKKYNMAVSSCG